MWASESTPQGLLRRWVSTRGFHARDGGSTAKVPCSAVSSKVAWAHVLGLHWGALSKLQLISMVYIYLFSVYMCMPWYACEGQRRAFWNQFSPSTMWVSGTELRLLRLGGKCPSVDPSPWGSCNGMGVVRKAMVMRNLRWLFFFFTFFETLLSRWDSVKKRERGY